MFSNSNCNYCLIKSQTNDKIKYITYSEKQLKMSDFTKDVNECLLKIKQGDKSQYEPLFQMTAMHLCGVARFYLTNKDLVEDVISETFIRVFKYIDSFDLGQNGYNWMCKIVQNVAITYNVTENKIARSEQQFAKEVAEISRNDYDEIDFLEQFDVLSTFDKEIAVERFCLGLSFDDIGKRHDMSKPAAFQRVKKICKIMKNK